jgi:hypothetical protein
LPNDDRSGNVQFRFLRRRPRDAAGEPCLVDSLLFRRVASGSAVAAPGSRRSFAVSRLLSRSSSIHTHFSSLTIRHGALPPCKGIAHYWPTAVPLPPPGNHGGNLEGSTAGTNSMSTTLLHARRLCPFLCGGHRQVARENLARRQPLAVYERTASQPELRNSDRLFWPGCPGVERERGYPRARFHGVSRHAMHGESRTIELRHYGERRRW